jgi:hypothetical protein
MSTLKGKLEQRKNDKYVGETTEAGEIEKDLLAFYTNAIAYLIKWFNFSEENYLSHCPV